MSKEKKRHWDNRAFTYRTFAVFISMLLLSNVGLAAGRDDMKAEQQPREQQTNSAAAERAFDEGMKLYDQGTAESLRYSIGKWEEALKLYRQIDDKGKQALTLLGIGYVYGHLGEKQKALEYYNQALPLYRAVGDRGEEATTLNNIGTVYSDLGEKQKGLEYFNQALPLHRAVGNRGGEATTLNNIGRVYSDLGEKQKALEYYNQALPLLRAVGDRGREANVLNNIGSVYSDLGEKQKGLEYFNQALPVLRAVVDRGGQATTLNSIGSVYSDLGEKQKGLEYFNQALPLLRAVGDRSGEAATLTVIGLVYSDLGEKQKALEYYNQALLLLRAVADRGGEAATLNSIGSVYSALGEKQKALEYYNQALPLLRAVGDRGREANVLNNIGSVYSDLGEKQKGLEYFNQALPLHRAVGNRGGEATTLKNLAYTERDRGNLQESLKQIQSAIQIIEDLRKTYNTNKDLQSTYFASVQDYYQFYIDLLIQLHKKEPSKGYDAVALNASERSRARGLVELLAEAGANIRKGVDPKLLATEQLLLDKIDATQKQIQELAAKPNNETRIERLKKERENLRTQYHELQTQIRITSPEYAVIQYPQPLELKQIQQQLDPDTVLLQYSLGKDRSYLWAVTPDSMNAYELPGKKQIEDAANNFRDVMLSGNTPYGKDNPDAINKPASQLSQIILAPVADKLGKKRLVIVADGVLQNIPFAALTDPEAGQLNKSSNVYQPLFVNHEIVNLPSVTALATHRQQLNKRELAPKTLAVLADPVFEADDERFTGKKPALAPEFDPNRSTLQRAIKNLKRNAIARLEGTRKEAEAILKLVSPSQSLHAYDFDANYNFANSKELKQYRFLLFATHGIVDTTSPELSGIVLSQIDKQGKPVKNGYLRLGDIFNLDLGAELVVLSACETGLGKDVKGEGLMGLTRGLMYAGSKRAVVSLWQVDDAGTSQFMPLFYKSVLAGESPTSALRVAQLQLWQQKQWQNPYYWAAFTLQGEWR